MTTINTTDELIKVLREDEAVRSAVRRELLTEELVALPGRFETMLETQNSMLETQNSMLETQNLMLAELKSLREGQRDAAEHRAILQKQHREEHEALHRFRGNYAIDAARKNRAPIAALFAGRYQLRSTFVRPLTSEERRDMLVKNSSALEEVGLREGADARFVAADLVGAVEDLYAPGETRYYIAVEASYTGNVKDVERATDHVKILRCATGLDAHAVVAAVRMNPNIQDRLFDDADEYVAANDDKDALWYQVVEKDMEPPDPC